MCKGIDGDCVVVGVVKELIQESVVYQVGVL